MKEFAMAFKSFHTGRAIENELSVPFDKSKSHPAALTTTRYGVSGKELLKANIDREILLMKRNSFVYMFRTFQVTQPTPLPAKKKVPNSMIDWHVSKNN